MIRWQIRKGLDDTMQRMMKQNQRLRRLSCVLSLTMLALVGCCSTFNNPTPKPSLAGKGVIAGAVYGAAIGVAIGGAGAGPAGPVVGVLAGGIAGGAMGQYLGRHQSPLWQLQQQGIKVVQVGDNMRIILASDKLFYPNSATFLHNGEYSLNLVAKLLRHYPIKSSLDVDAYTDTHAAAAASLALSKQRAQAVAGYLWEDNIDARFVVAHGYGASQFINTNTTAAGRADNRRVEVKFRILHDV